MTRAGHGPRHRAGGELGPRAGVGVGFGPGRPRAALVRAAPDPLAPTDQDRATGAGSVVQQLHPPPVPDRDDPAVRAAGHRPSVPHPHPRSAARRPGRSRPGGGHRRHRTSHRPGRTEAPDQRVESSTRGLEERSCLVAPDPEGLDLVHGPSRRRSTRPPKLDWKEPRPVAGTTTGSATRHRADACAGCATVACSGPIPGGERLRSNGGQRLGSRRPDARQTAAPARGAGALVSARPASGHTKNPGGRRPPGFCRQWGRAPQLRRERPCRRGCTRCTR